MELNDADPSPQREDFVTPTPFGNYLLLERLDGGGISEVLKAKAFGVKDFERLVVVKRVLPSVAEDPSFVPILLDETKPSLQLRHPNIAEVFDIGLRDQVFFLAMEYVQGRSLRELLDRQVATHSPVPAGLACFIAMKAAAGLSHAHHRRDPEGRVAPLIHNGLSPSNVLLSRRGEVKLADFGFGTAASRVGRTRTGLLRGKFGYMSPEQVRGMEPDPRSDVFSAGVCLYELLTASRLFEGESDFLTLDNVRSANVVPPSQLVPEVDAELDAIVLRALTRRADQRFASAGEFHDQLQTYLFRARRHVAAEDLADYLEQLFGMEIERESERDGQFLEMPWPGRETVEVANPSQVAPTSAEQVASSLENSVPVEAQTRNVHSPPVGETSSRPPPLPLEQRPRGKKKPAPGRRPAAIGSHSRGPKATPARRPGVGILGGGPALRLGVEEDELATEVYSGADSEESASGSGQRGVGSSAPQLLSLAGPPSQPLAPPSYASPRLPPPAKLPRRMGSDRAGNPSPFERLDKAGPRGAGWGLRGPVRPLTLWMLLTVLFMLAATGLVYYFMGNKPGSLVVSTVPRDAVVLFDEKPVSTGASLSPFVIENIESTHRHLLEVQREGYRDFRQMVEIDSGKTLKLPTIELVPLRGGGAVVAPVTGGTGFSLSTEPAGARVYVDGRELDQRTPVKVGNLAPGTYQVRVERGQRYVPWETAVTVLPGRVRELPAAQLALRSATVKFRSEPSGAAVTLVRGAERRSIGSTPTNADVEIVGAAWTVEMERDGFAHWSAELRAPLGREEFELVATLIPGEVDATRGADSRARARTADRSRSAPGVRGQRQRTTRNTSPQTRGVREPRTGSSSQAAPNMDATVQQPSGNGTLQVNSIPWAQVYVDGRMVGNTPQMNLSLSPGIHAVMLVNPDFSIQKSFAVEIRGGQTTRRVVRLPLGD